MGTPLELIKYNGQNGKFEVGAKALDALRKVKGPIAVVAVCGRARQGKSFILNQLLKSSGSGFQVGATHRPCTKGLWMWSTPQLMTCRDGSTHHLVLLDTEGIDAYDQTAQYSTQIFSLAVLLSSLFVYNQMGGIDESALDRLSLVTEMTKHVRVRAAAASDGSEEGLGEHSPAFLWLLRDFYLQLEEEGGRKITPREYLETALRPVPGTGPAVASKNAIRASISQLFPARDCFTLVRPMNDEAALSQMDTLPRAKLRPEFRQGVDDLTALIFQRATPKRFGSQLMNGSVLAGLVNAYVSAINHGAVPTIATAWQGVAESECRRGCDAAEAAYMEAWSAGGEVPAEEAELDARHQQCLAAAKSAYEEVAVGDEGIRKAHEARWMAAVSRRYTDLRGRRLAEAAAAVNDMLMQGGLELVEVARSCTELNTLQQRVGSFVAQYSKAAAGPTKWKHLAAFLGETWPKMASDVLDRQAAAAKSAIEAVQRESAELRGQLAAERLRAEQAERFYNDTASANKNLQQQLAEYQQEAVRLRATLDQKADTAAALNQQLGLAQQEMAHLRSVLEQRSSAAAALQQQVEVMKNEGTRVMEALQDQTATASSLRQQLGEHQQEVTRLRSALDQKAGVAGALEQQLGEHQQEAARLRAALDQKAGAASSLQKQLEEAHQEAARLRAALDQKASKVAALEGQMAEVLLVSERKQAKAGELAEAHVRAAAEAHQAKLAEMTATLTAERARADSLAADLEALVARCSSTEARLAAQEADASEWRTKYMREATVRLETQGARDKAADEVALLKVERDSVARERDAARAELEQLRADLQAEVGAKGAIQARLEVLEAEAHAARAQALGGGGGGALTSSRYGAAHNDENSHPAGGAGINAGGAADGGASGRVLVDAGNIASMTVQEIRDTLTLAGYADEVWSLTNRKPAPKKADWVELLRRRAA